MREDVLRALARRAASDPHFLRQARQDLEGTLARQGYRLAPKERRLVEDFRHQTAGMSHEELTRLLVGGLERRSRSRPARPDVPSWRGSGPARPARPGT